MMFLQADTIPPLIVQMQQATVPGGYNLIVCAMDTDDIRHSQTFRLVLSRDSSVPIMKAGIWKYNENVGELHRVDEQGNRLSSILRLC